jgi:xanthine/uracil/vitamin C permease (AzgA family)
MITHVLLKLFTGRGDEVRPGMWVLALLSLLLFVCLSKL